VARSLGEGGAAAKPDIAGEFVRNIPGILGGVTNLLGELRSAETLRRASAPQSPAAAIAAHNPAPVVAAAIHVPAAPVATAPVAQAGPPPGSPPSPEWVFGRIYELVSTGESGGYVKQFIEEMDAQFIAQLKMVTVEDIKIYIINHPILGRLKDYPRLDAFLAEFFAALHEGDSKPAMTN
jgi:hypothetical protein